MEHLTCCFARRREHALLGQKNVPRRKSGPAEGRPADLLGPRESTDAWTTTSGTTSGTRHTAPVGRADTYENLILDGLLVGERSTRVAYRLPSGVARKRPPRRTCYKISCCARRPMGGRRT
eukprot:2905467-Pyramimonas_sp.AAC.1